MNRKILFVAATSWELKALKEKVSEIKDKKNKYFFFCSWIWNFNTIFSLTSFLEKNKDFDFILNIWICWFKDEKRDFIQIWRSFCPEKNQEILIPIYFKFWEIFSTLSSEKIIFKPENLKNEQFAEMESFWFEFVLEKFWIPRIILKVPVDKVWEETENFDFKKALKNLGKNIDYKKLLEEVDLFLEKNEKESYDFLYKAFSFTFTEKVLLEKDLLKFESFFWKKDLKKYLKNSLNNNKKDFLQKISKKVWQKI